MINLKQIFRFWPSVKHMAAATSPPSSSQSQASELGKVSAVEMTRVEEGWPSYTETHYQPINGLLTSHLTYNTLQMRDSGS